MSATNTYLSTLPRKPAHVDLGEWVFGPDYPGKDHFDTGPVVGFAVTDLPGAVQELREAGVELLGEPGLTWQHFRGPDGNVYELTSA